MRRVTFDIEFLTPSFIGGSDQTRAELTGNGIRGQLRWWLRAVAGGRYGGDLARTAQLEQTLFGTADSRSPLRVVVTRQPDRCRDPLPNVGLTGEELARHAGLEAGRANSLVVRKEGREVATNAIAYLGFGPVTSRGTTTREYVKPRAGGCFFLQQGSLSPTSQEILGDAIWAWMNLGGIGSRSRRGFGSFRCIGVQGDASSPVCKDLQSFEDAWRVLRARNLAAATPVVPEWSHLSASTAVFRATAPCKKWEDAMAAAAAWLIAFRRRYGMKTGADYEWFKALRATGIPHRAGFGLPLPFGQGDLVVNWKGNRRASPLLLHIAKFGEDYYPLFTYMPARFLPANAEMTFRGFRARADQRHSTIVGDFLAGLASRGKAVEIV